MEKQDLYTSAINAAVKAGYAIMEIYEHEVIIVENKKDESPLTQADLVSNEIINQELLETKIPIISEENKELSYAERKDWEECWIVDPLDGTKEFIKRNGEFTVNIALCKSGKPIFGVIYVPVTKELFIGDVLEGKSYKVVFNENEPIDYSKLGEANQIYPKSYDGAVCKVVGSRSHMNEDTENFVNDLKKQFSEIEVVSKGSSLKFCLVAEGKADFYPRFAPTMEWDTAAGHAICNAVGLKVISRDTNEEMVYNKKKLLNPFFLVSK